MERDVPVELVISCILVFFVGRDGCSAVVASGIACCLMLRYCSYTLERFFKAEEVVALPDMLPLISIRK